jgi:hypothetical protein
MVVLATDPEALQKHQAKTPHQKLTSLTTFGGAEIPLDPIARMFAAGMFPILDHVSGAADGKWNPDFMETLDNYLHGTEGQDATERYHKDQEIALWDAVKQNNPLDPSAIPGVTGIEAAMDMIPVCSVLLVNLLLCVHSRLVVLIQMHHLLIVLALLILRT